MSKQRYVRGAHTVTELKHHFVWQTKYSYRVLKGGISLRLRDIIAEICKEIGMVVLKGNIHPNHIHIYNGLWASISIGLENSTIISRVNVSIAYRESFRDYERDIEGSICEGKGICTNVRDVTEQQIKDYIENQTEAPRTFKVWDLGEQPESNVSKVKLDNSSEWLGWL